MCNPYFQKECKSKKYTYHSSVKQIITFNWKIGSANYTAVFTNKDVKICKAPLNIPENDTLLTGHRDAQNGLYVTDLNNKYTTHTANNIVYIHNSTTKFNHILIFSSLQSGYIHTNKCNQKSFFFQSWPGLTVDAIKKYVSNMPHVSAGRQDHVRKNIRSTKLKQVLNSILHNLRPTLAPLSTTTNSNTTHIGNSNTSNDDQSQDHYLKIESMQKIYTDQTGRCPKTSSNGYKYRFVSYASDANAILVEPIKNRSAGELVRVHDTIIQFLTQKECKTNMHYLVNEAPQSIKVYDTNNKIKYHLVPPFSQRRNAAKRAIHTWKNHFITSLCSVDPLFPMHLWDRLTPQSVITLNILQPSRRNPNVSAYEALNGKINYDATPLAPPGCKVIAL